MADDVRRWSVTYTKHVKQKRKVYQDGFLELQSSSHKVKLYDDCNKLLDSRIVKLDDTVRSGETFTFGAYLVDIGDPHGDYKPIPTMKHQKRNQTTAESDCISNNSELRDNSTSVETRKCYSGISKPSSTKLSPSQKIIREFKRREANKYCTSPSFPETIKTNFTEWQVLYTTQLTQKARKFHDGILRLAICGLQQRQVLLYDATRRLLDSRFLKKDEVISCGESLTFDGHLVDIGELQGDRKPLTDLNVEGGHFNVQSAGPLKIQKKNVPESKKNGTNLGFKYSAAARCPDITNTNPTEWKVLYTTHLTQKAKKFHDGILRLATCGSQGRQVMLYDATKRLLDSRFLKKDEIVKSGESLRFDGHLVEIDEIEGEHMPKADLDFEGRSCNIDSQADRGGPFKIHNNNPIEWDVLYTTQVNQKAKKYHTGIIRLASCGSYRMQAIGLQATLLAEDGTTLARKYLKLSEDINCGSLFHMPNYLVEVGELRKLSEEEHPKVSASENGSPKISSFDVDGIKLSKRISATKHLSDGEASKGAFSLQHSDPKIRSSGTDKVISRTVNTNKPVRDALSILSFLRKPSIQEGIVGIGVSQEECHAPPFLAFVQSDVQNQVEGLGNSSSKRIKVESAEEKSTFHDYSMGVSKCKPVNADLSTGTTTSADSDNGPDEQPKDHISPEFSSGLETPFTIRSACDVESTRSNRKTPSSSILEPRILEPFNVDSNGMPLTASKLHCESSGPVNVGGHPNVMSSRATTTFNFNELAKKVKDDRTSQIYGDDMAIESSGKSGSCPTTSSSNIHHHDSSDERKSSEEHTNTRTDDCPSFDLGFD